jgi:osmotically-inducible protein OsmY
LEHEVQKLKKNLADVSNTTSIKGGRMKIRTFRTTLLLLISIAILSACSSPDKKTADVRSDIRASLDKAGLKDVSVDQDRDKGVVTLSGKVPTEGEKTQAAAIANSWSGGQVVANQIEVVTPGDESDSKAVNSDLDKGIEKNLDAALIQKDLHDDVSYEVKNAVVTLKGEVNSQARRSDAEKTAASVPNVKQVVNNLQIKDQRATSRN